MSLKPEYDGDALKAAGALLAISKSKTTDEVNGLYVLSKEGTFIRGDGMWHTATGLALHQLNGSKLIPMRPDFIDTFDAIDVKGTVPTAQEIEAGRTKGKPDSRDTQQTNITAAKAKQATKAAKAAKTDKTKKAKKAGKCPVSDTGGVSQTTVRRAWHLASRIVASRPWLEISGVGQYDVPSHLVVHDGPYGAALHFADDEGPTWEPRSAPEQDLHWEDVEDVDAVNPTGAVDWVERWGPPAPSTKLTLQSCHLHADRAPARH